MGFSRQEYWSGLPFPSPVDHILSDLSTVTHPSWVAPWAWLSSIELDKAVVLVWLDWLVFCDYGFSVSALWCPLATPTILLWFLLPWKNGISFTATLPDLQRGIAPLGPPVPVQPQLLGCGVGPPGHHPWPQTQGNCSRRYPWPRMLGISSRPPPNLGHRVTLLGRCPLGMGSSWLLPLTSDMGWLLSATLSASVAAACT